MPATPPPARPCGRTSEAEKCSSWASDVTKTSSSSPVVELDRADEDVAVVERDEVPLVAADRCSGLTRLTMPSRVPSAMPAPLSSSGVSASDRAIEAGDLPQRHAALQVGRLGGRRQRRQLEHVEMRWTRPSDDDDADLAAGCRAYGRDDRVVLDPAVDVAERASRRTYGRAGPVADSSAQHGSSATSSGEAAVAVCPDDSSSTVRRGVPNFWAISLSSSPTTLRSSCSSPRIASSSSMILRELVALALDLDADELGEPAERAGRGCRSAWISLKVEHRHEAFLGLGCGCRCARISWMTSSMSTSAMSRPSSRCSRSAALPRRNCVRRRTTSIAVLEVDLEHLLESQRAGLAVDERHGVDAERALHRRALVELLEDRLGDEPVLDLDDEVEPLVAVGEVLDVGDALELLGLDELLDRLDDLLGTDVVGQLGDDDALASGRDALDACRGAHAERAVARGVRVADALEPDDLAAGRQIGAGDEPHEVVEVGRRVA